MKGEHGASTLLNLGDYGGTLAALRLMARRGVSVHLAEYRRWVPSRHSRFLSRTLSCPPPSDWTAFMQWLFAYGEAHPGTFLYPTSDDMAWLYAQYADRLRPHFLLWQPSARVIYTLLNKKLLSQVCDQLSIAVPRTYFPTSREEIEEGSRQLKAPYLLKPLTQIGLKIGHKGRIVTAKDDPHSAYEAFKDQLVYQPELLAYDETVAWPMMQEYYAGAMQSIVSIAGFVAADGSIVARSSRKVLQRPRRLGIGLCFESIPLDAALVKDLERLCRHVGYYGIFEAEFIEEAAGGQGRRLLIDFNPRYYGQMGFEIARGLPLPYLALLAARGSGAELARELEAARLIPSDRLATYSTTWLLRLSLFAGWISRKHSGAELLRWRRWRFDPRHHYTDAVYDAQDPRPYFIDMLVNGARYLRHPRDFIRKFFLDT